MLSAAAVTTAATVLLAATTITTGGAFLLRVTRGQAPANDLQRSFYRAGHGHAGMFITLGLVVLLLVDLAGVGQPWRLLSTGVLWAAVLMPAGFFLSVLGKDPQRPGRLVALLWLGAAALVLGLVSAAVGLLLTG